MNEWNEWMNEFFQAAFAVTQSNQLRQSSEWWLLHAYRHWLDLFV